MGMNGYQTVAAAEQTRALQQVDRATLTLLERVSKRSKRRRLSGLLFGNPCAFLARLGEADGDCLLPALHFAALAAPAGA